MLRHAWVWITAKGSDHPYWMCAKCGQIGRDDLPSGDYCNPDPQK